MTIISLSNLLKDLIPCQQQFDISVTGLSLDSRTVQKGDLFFACQGTHVDGRKFIPDVIKKTPSAILAEYESQKPECYVEQSIPIVQVKNLNQKISAIAARFYKYPAQSLEIVGITGTNGKTSCSHFIAAILNSLQKPCGVIGTLGTGLYGQLQENALTTPDAITLQKTFAEFLASHAQYVSMEVSSHSLEQGRVHNIPFKVGVFTNLTRDHLDYHGTMAAYGAAKRKLFANSLLQNAVINLDDPFSAEIIKSLPAKIPCYGYSTQNEIEIKTASHLTQATNIMLHAHGLSADISSPWGQGTLTSSLIGSFNLSNLLAVLNAVCLLGQPFDKVLAALSHVQSVAGRMQAFKTKNSALVVVDYSHTPDSLEKALLALRQHCNGKLYVVFGCGGDRDKGKRPVMAEIAEKNADVVIVTDDNPRTEVPEEIVLDILKGFMHPRRVLIEHSRARAITYALQTAQADDCVLIAGKGAETYQLIGTKKLPFSDIDQVNTILQSYNE